MRRSRDELVAKFSEIIGDNNSDDALSFMEDLSDSLEDTDKDEIEAWKRKYEENDADWRRRYRERFMGKTEDPAGESSGPTYEPDGDSDDDGEGRPIRDLFKSKSEEE